MAIDTSAYGTSASDGSVGPPMNVMGTSARDGNAAARAERKKTSFGSAIITNR